jgi:hypothetical protein
VNLDLSRAAIVPVGEHRAIGKAADLLRGWIRSHSDLSWTQATVPDSILPSVILGTAADLKQSSGHGWPPATHEQITDPEGFVIWLDAGAPARIWLVGADPRGVLYAVGRLIRWLEIRPVAITLPRVEPGLLMASHPRFPVRGHQLGYRHRSNSYDAWDVSQFETYVQELVLFGVNSVELIPTLDPAEPPEPHMPLAPWEMNLRLSGVLDSCDLDVWIWLPVEDGDPRFDPDNMLARRARLFESMPRLDHVFVPGGDPGDLPAVVLLDFLGRMAEVLHQFHPGAGVWIAPQGYNRAELDSFYLFLHHRQPAWLTGVVYGPWIRDSLAEVRVRTPERYPIRRYPDIGHTVRCQYPVVRWDPAFALTLGREPINPRPVDYAWIHDSMMDDAVGAITYSDGVNDDVNKVVWSDRLWDPTRPVRDTLAEYGRVFIGPASADLAADGFLALEANWRGPLDTSEQIAETYVLWARIVATEGRPGSHGWRLEMAWFRAQYDRYVQLRMQIDGAQEKRALGHLADAISIGSAWAAQRSLTELAGPETTPEIDRLRQQILESGDRLWKSIGMQLSVPKHHAAESERGAVLDYLDEPLNDREWLSEEIALACTALDEPTRIDGLLRLVQWTDPGPGGFYDDGGNAQKEPRLVRGDPASDPGFLKTSLDEFTIRAPGRRLSWCRQACTLHDTPLDFIYGGLDPYVEYRVKVVYTGRFRSLMRLEANGLPVHGPLGEQEPPVALEFALSREATRSGTLRLRWFCERGRGCQVAEVWLVPAPCPGKIELVPAS